MSYGCMINVINLTNHKVTLSPVDIVEANEWENSSLTPAQLNGAVIEKNSQIETHVEIANGASSATFVVTFVVDTVGSVQTVADAYPVVDGGNRKGYLWYTGGNSVDKFWILEAQYPKQPWDKYEYDWRHLGIIIMPKIDPRNWMSRVGDDAKMWDITIPGSHDTGTAAIAASGSINASRICQGLSIAQQLNIGVRFLDIRLNKSRNWEIMHEDSSTGLFFVNDCLLPVINFLNENPKETVLMCIKDEHGTTDHFHDGILEMLGKCAPSKVHTGQTLPNLGDLRGKVVLLRRYWIDDNNNNHKVNDPDSGFGLHKFSEFSNGTGAEYPWFDNSDTFAELGDGKVTYQQPGGQPVVLQDWYNIHDSYMSTKIGLISKYLNSAKTELQGTLFFNFTSCCTTTRVGFPKDFAVGEGNINDALFLYAINNGKDRYGIVPMDFVGCPPEEATVNLLINCNWLKE